jgi:hypothetical protein
MIIDTRRRTGDPFNLFCVLLLLLFKQYTEEIE